MLAYAGLADAYAVLPVYSIESPRDAFPKARAAAAMAFKIDDSLAQPHATLAIVLAGYDWNWTAAESELRKAIALDPSYPTARQWLALVLTCQGRFNESLAQLRRARELDPFSVPIQASITMTHLYARQYDLAIEEGRKVDSTAAYRNWYIAQAYEAKKMTEQALAEYQKVVGLSGRTSRGLMILGESQVLAGSRSEALRTIEEMKSLSARQYVSPAAIAVVYAGLGEKDRAFEWLEKAYADHSWDLIYLGVDPRFDGLRTDSRFADLLRRIHLAPQPAWYAPRTSPK